MPCPPRLKHLVDAVVQANLTMMTFVATVCAHFRLELAPEVRQVKKRPCTWKNFSCTPTTHVLSRLHPQLVVNAAQMNSDVVDSGLAA